MRRHVIPEIDELRARMQEAGIEDAPIEAPDAERLRGLLDLALFVAEHRKRVSFDAFSWDDPGFVSTDEKVRLRFAHAALEREGAEGLHATLVENLPRVRDGRTLLALDARPTGAREYEVDHWLFGEVTMFSWPTKPPEPADPRIDAARERGWMKALKDHNLVPGRGIVVLDEHQGLLLRDDRLDALVGLLVLYASGETKLVWNPFVRADANDSELQYWLAWGPGAPASAWREVFRADE